MRITIPVNYKRRSSRKLIISPSDPFYTPMLAQDENKDETILKALQKAFIWQEKLDNGTYDTVQECSEQEGVEITHMYRILRLTYLAPEIVEAITLGTQPRTLTLQNIIRGFPLLWQEQKQQFGFV